MILCTLAFWSVFSPSLWVMTFVFALILRDVDSDIPTNLFLLATWLVLVSIPVVAILAWVFPEHFSVSLP